MMNENTMDHLNMMMDGAAENMNRQKMNALPDSPKSMISQSMRTPLLDVKNQFRSKARQRMSTGSVKSSGISLKNRLSLNDQESGFDTQKNVKFFTQQNAEEGNVPLVIPEKHSEETEDCQENDSALAQSSRDSTISMELVDESALQDTMGELSMGANEVSRDGELLKEVMSVLDQDFEMPIGLIETMPLEQNESFALPSHEYSNIQSTQEILSNMQALEFEDGDEGKEVEIDSDTTFTEPVLINGEIETSELESCVTEEDLTLSELSGEKHLPDPSISDQSTTLLEPGEIETDESLPSEEVSSVIEICSESQFSPSSIPEQNTNLLKSVEREGNVSFPSDEMNSMIETDPEQQFLGAANSFEYLSSSLREPLNDTDILLASSGDLEMIGEDIHELSSIRLVEGCDDSTLDGLLEKTLIDEIQNDFKLSTNHPEVEEITATLERLSHENSISAGCFSAGIESLGDSDRKMDGSFRFNGPVEDQPLNELFLGSQSFVDLSISEAEVLNCFNCNSDISKFIDEFLKETPVVERHQGRPMRCKPQTVGKRDDIWPDERDKEQSDDDLTRDDESSVLEVIQTELIATEQNSLEKVYTESQDLFSSEKKLSIVELVDDESCTSTSEQLSGVAKEDKIVSIKKDSVAVLAGRDLSGNDDRNSEEEEEESNTVCGEEASGDGIENPGGGPESLLVKMIKTQEDVSKLDDLYSTRVSKVLETLRDAYVAPDRFANVERSLSIEIPKPHLIESLNGMALEEAVQDFETNVRNDASVTDTQVVEAAMTVRERLSLNRSTIDMQEEIKCLEFQMVEMKGKVAWLESQIENNNQPAGDDQSHQNDSDPVGQPRNFSSMVEIKGTVFNVNGSEGELAGGQKLMDELEVRLSEELLKTKDLEGHVKDVERKCSLLEKERLKSELTFAQELKRLKSEYSQSICHQQADEEQRVELLDQDFDCMMSEFERLTTLQKKLKDMLNRVMRTTNESLAGYAKLLKDYSKLQENNQSLEAHLSTSKTDNKKVVDDIEVLENLLQRSNDSIKDLHEFYQDEIDNLKSQVNTLSEAQDVAAKEKEASKKGLEEHVYNLQRSVDRLETERQMNQEEMEDTRFLLEHQKTKNQTLSEEVEELRKIKVDWVAGQDLIKELQDTLSFLNEERDASVSEYEASRKLTASLEDQLKSLSNANEEYQNSQDQLQTEVSGLRERLHLTSEDASLLLAALEEIATKADSLLDTLQQKFAIELSANTAKATPRELLAEKGASSLVAQVLSRAGIEEGQRPNTCSKLCSNTQKPFCRQSNVEYGSVKRGNNASSQSFSASESHTSTRAPSSRKALDFSSPLNANASDIEKMSSSQMFECHAGATSQDSSDRLNTSIPGFAHIRSIPVSGKKEEKEENVSSESEDFNVVAICENVLEHIEQKFSIILKIAHTADRTSKLKFRDLRGEVELLNEKYKMKRGLSEKLDAELESKRNQLGESRDDIERLNDRINRMTQAILKHEDMTYEVKRLEEDNQDLQQEMANLKGERDMLSNQVQDLIAKTSGSEGEHASMKKLAAFEKKYYQLHRFMLQEQEKNTEKGEKAMRRIRVLEMNLKRAEEEVYKFDELVEAIRNTCIENRSMRTHPVLLHVVRLIDGLVEVENKSTASKTSRGSSSKTPASASSASHTASSTMPASSTRGKKEEYPV